VYDAVKRIERHLRRNYTYSERPPTRKYPLESFLFQDRIGYCQQFSGAMALMLRMVGIPARPVSGFSPGSLNRDSGEYRVRDLDAHSWVEVYFSDIGWVTFDPTPAAAPADRAGAASDPAADPRRDAGSVNSDSSASAGGDVPQGSSARRAPDDGGGVSAAALIAFAAAGLVLAAALMAVRRRRRLAPAAASDASLQELRRALQRLGWELSPSTTLLELERRLGRVAGPGAAGYASRLRAGRFARGRTDPPAPSERRALRRELTAGRGLRARVRGFLALPPGKPFIGS
jgi:protein-glutamine gamma-glutamyltransferase